MNWTAPDVTRTDGSLVAPEREMLQDYLHFHRTTFLTKCVGLTGSQLAVRAAPPSSVSLLGLIRHLAKVEPFTHNGDVYSLRLIYLHVMGEYARHTATPTWSANASTASPASRCTRSPAW